MFITLKNYKIISSSFLKNEFAGINSGPYQNTGNDFKGDELSDLKALIKLTKDGQIDVTEVEHILSSLNEIQGETKNALKNSLKDMLKNGFTVKNKADYDRFTKVLEMLKINSNFKMPSYVNLEGDINTVESTENGFSLVLEGDNIYVYSSGNMDYHGATYRAGKIDAKGYNKLESFSNWFDYNTRFRDNTGNNNEIDINILEKDLDKAYTPALESKIKELESKNKELESKIKELESKNKEAEAEIKELESKIKELESKNKELESKIKELESKNKEAESKNKEVESKNKEAESKNKEVESKNKEVESKNKEVESKNKEAESKNKEAESKNKEVESKNKEVEDKSSSYVVKSGNTLYKIVKNHYKLEDKTEISRMVNFVVNSQEEGKMAKRLGKDKSPENFRDGILGDKLWVGDKIKLPIKPETLEAIKKSTTGPREKSTTGPREDTETLKSPKTVKENKNLEILGTINLGDEAFSKVKALNTNSKWTKIKVGKYTNKKGVEKDIIVKGGNNQKPVLELDGFARWNDPDIKLGVIKNKADLDTKLKELLESVNK